MSFISDDYSYISGLTTHYDALLVDLWGVIHDGQSLYPGVQNCLEQLRIAGKRICFLSNAPRRSTKAQAKLDELRISRQTYERIITSGELTFLRLSSQHPNSRYYFIGPDRDLDVMQGSGLIHTTSLAEAEFLLNVGFLDHEDGTALARYMPMLKEAKERGLPMICANPDDFIVRLSGERLPCAGVMGEAYATLGGAVTWYGKPYKDVYDLCLSFWPEIARERVLAIGDNLTTDIKGGRGAGIATALVTGGVLKVELGLKPGDAPPLAALNARYEQSGIQPDYLLEDFTWK